jgi:hypothetical protein
MSMSNSSEDINNQQNPSQAMGFSVPLLTDGSLTPRIGLLLTMLLLIGSLLIERYCFIMTVHMTQNFSFVTVFVVIVLNCTINVILKYC